MKNKIVITFIFGLTLAGSCLAQGLFPKKNDAVSKLNYAVQAIENLYVDTINQNKLVEDAIISLLEKLDPHSEYMTAKETKEMNEPLQGNFEGIGIQFNMMKDTLFVVQTIAGGPSERVGIMAGDRIVAVNDSIIAGVNMNNTDIMKRLRGKKGTTVYVTVLRRGVNNLIDFKIIRDKIPIYSLDASYMIDNKQKVGYIKLNRFASTTHDEFLKAFKELQAQGMKSLILDLQGNGGGYMNAATDLANEFLKENQLIVYTEGMNQKRQTMSATGKGVFEKGNLVVLVDEGSASSSEIVTGALQDWDRAVVVGRRTFGKGLVQRPIPFSDGSMMKLTTARYYTPVGRCIQKPYDEGKKQYREDISNRYEHGEFSNADSIRFADSLKYNTKVSGRIVYGGGGIMPDCFVPIDTTRYSVFHRNLVAKGVLNRYIISHFEKNRDDLKQRYTNFDAFNKGFAVTDEMMQELLKAAEDDKVKFDEEQYNRSKSTIELQIKALVAQNLFGQNEYYRVINSLNATLNKAVEIIGNNKEYEKLLSGK